MPLVPKKKAYDPVTDRRQSIVGDGIPINDHFTSTHAHFEHRGRKLPSFIKTAGDGVALKSAEHPTPKTDPHDFGDAVETIEIEVPEGIVILDNAPPVPRTNHPDAKWAPLVRALKVGGFIFIPASKVEASSQANLCATLRHEAYALRIKITTRTNYNFKGRIGVGVWRLK